MRRDDGAGPEAARRLRALGAEAVEHAGDGAALLGLWEGRESVVLIDAMRSGAPPGTVRRLDAHREEIPRASFANLSHAFGVAEAVDLARSLGRLPESLVVYGIEATDFGLGDGMTPEVARAVDGVVAGLRP